MKRIHEIHVKALMEWRKLLDDAFSVNHALKAKVKSESFRGRSKKYAPGNVTDSNPETYWATN